MAKKDLIYFADRRAMVNPIRLPKGNEDRANALRDGAPKGATLGELQPSVNGPIPFTGAGHGTFMANYFGAGGAGIHGKILWNPYVGLPIRIDKIWVYAGSTQWAEIYNVVNDTMSTGTPDAPIYDKWSGLYKTRFAMWKDYQITSPIAWNISPFAKLWWRGRIPNAEPHMVYEHDHDDPEDDLMILLPGRGLLFAYQGAGGDQGVSVEFREIEFAEFERDYSWILSLFGVSK